MFGENEKQYDPSLFVGDDKDVGSEGFGNTSSGGSALERARAGTLPPNPIARRPNVDGKRIRTSLQRMVRKEVAGIPRSGGGENALGLRERPPFPTRFSRRENPIAHIEEFVKSLFRGRGVSIQIIEVRSIGGDRYQIEINIERKNRHGKKIFVRRTLHGNESELDEKIAELCK